MLEESQPILVADLLPKIHAELIKLLRSLSVEEWQKPTMCPGWNVKDVALHLLGVEIGNLSRRRDGHMIKANLHSHQELIATINDWNQSWVSVARRMSPRLVIDLLELTGGQICTFFQQLAPFAPGGAVSWAGPEPAPVWLDLAREYTERWHHQQHIRDAVGRPGLKEPEFFSPVLQAFMRALPYTYRDIPTDEKASVTVTVNGPAGGKWSIVNLDRAWHLYNGAPASPTAEVIFDQETAWRLCTRGITQQQALEQSIVQGGELPRG